MRKLAVLGSVLALLCWQTPLSVARIHPATNHEPFRDRFSVQDERKTAAAVQKQGHPEVRGRQLLASAVSQQNISYLLYGTFQQEFVYFANTTLSGYDLPPVAGKCSMDTTLDPAVANCASRNQLCCFDASYSQDLSTLPRTLADMCNKIALNGSVCQGFTFDSATNLAVFKGQAALQAANVSRLSNPSDNVSLWWLNAANTANQSVDHRPVVLEAAPQYKRYLSAIANCPNVGNYAQDPVTTRYLVQGPQYIAKNVTTANPATSYSFYSYTDLALGDGLLPVNGSCNTNPNSTEFTAALNSCGNANSGCCLDMSSYTGDLPLEQYLAGVCNTIVLNGSVCQAFDYNTVSRIAYFKGQPPTLQIDYTTAACAFPNVTLWVLSSAEPGSGQVDERPTALALAEPVPVSPTPSSSGQGDGNNGAGSAWGTALGVATPCIGVMVWLAVTYTYRTEKRALVAGVLNRLTPIDIADEPPSNPKESPSQRRRVERNDSVSDLIAPAHREAAASPAMLKVAKEMTHRCLRRWDSFLALRASTDSQGMGQGIWRARYEGVRASVMLLAIHNLNRRLQTTAVAPYDGEPAHAGCLLAAWQQSNHSQKKHLLNLLVRQVHDISEDEAQALPDKDADRNSFYDKVVSWVHTKMTRK